MSDDKQSPFKLSDRDEWAWSLGYKQGQEEIDRLRAEVERRGKMLQRCWPCIAARALILEKFPKNPENLEQLHEAKELVTEIESLQPKPETDEHA